MKVGLTYDLKEDVSLSPSEPEDALEEYDSRETVAAIAAVIQSLGHSVVHLGGGRKFLVNVLKNKVDFVFNIAEGRGTYRGREAQVPSVLEMLNIPYSGADPQCLAIRLDKPLTKKLVALAGIPTAKEKVITCRQDLEEIDWNSLPFPAFVKPAYEGSSKGIRLSSRIEHQNQIAGVVTRLLERYQQPIMVEEFIRGDEVTVGIIGNCPPRVLGIMRVIPKKKEPDFFYSIEVKRDWQNLVDYECPAQLPARVLGQIADYSLSAFAMIGCRDFARLDFRVSPEGNPYFLEINPLAGLNPKNSDLCIMARAVGWSYEALIAAIFNAALQRYPQCR